MKNRMNKFFTTLVLGISLVAGAFAQSNQLPVDAGTVRKPGEVSAQSQTVTLTERGLDFLWLSDGYDGLAAISYTIAPISGTNGRLRLQMIGAADPNDSNNKTYLTMGLSYNLFNAANGFRMDILAAPKGFNASDGFRFQSGRGSVVFGVGFSIPLGF